MGRFLFVVPPLSGHVNPTIALGEELSRRGHSVAWTGHTQLVAPLLPRWAELIPLDHELPAEMVSSARERAMSLRGVAALEFLWREFLRPLAVAMVPDVEAAVTDFEPDCVVVDQQAFAGAIVARRREIAWVTSATTSAELVDPFHALPKVGDWVASQLVELQLEAGVEAAVATRGDLRFSDHLTIAFTTSALTGPLTLPAGSGPVVMVGPSLRGADREVVDSNLAQFLDRPGPGVLVTLGTVNAEAGGRFFAAALEAARHSSWKSVIVAPPEMIVDPPENVLVARFVPQLQVLDRVDAVVCHAGHNTVCESLAKGLPLVVAPIRDDQPIIAEQVEKCGAGVRVRFGRVGPKELKASVDEVLDGSNYRAAAVVVQASFASAGGAATAADSLDELIR